MLLSLSSAGCYVPPLTSQIDRDDFATLRPGEDTRARVEAQLHHPDAFLSTSRWLGALKSRSRGTIIIPAAAQGGGGGGSLGASQTWRMLFRFDDHSVLLGFDVELSHAEQARLPGQTYKPPEAQPAESLTAESPTRSDKPSFACVAADSMGDIAAGDAHGRVWLWPERSRAGPTQIEICESAGSRMGRWRPDRLLQVAFVDGARSMACLAKNGDLAIVTLPPSHPTPDVAPTKVAPFMIRRRVAAFDVSGDGGSIAIAGRDGHVEIFATATGLTQGTYRCPKTWKWGPIALSADGRFLAAAEFGRGLVRLRVRDLLGSRPDLLSDSTACRGGDGIVVQGMRFSPDGRLLAVDCLTHVQCWKLSNASSAGDDSLRLDHVFLRPFASTDPLIQAGLAPRRPPIFVCEGGGVAIAADGLYVYALNDAMPVPTCVLQGARGHGIVTDLAAIPGTRRVAATTKRGLFVWTAP